MSGENDPPAFTGACPLPLSDYPTVQLAHAGGGRLSQILLKSRIGGERVVDMLSGEQLPRIC